ncbi:MULTISPECIES: class C sortase [Streptococcus]|uniref:class C sortase n=1 Tax=Streptococcus TaxID=1301 RepID=UPI002B023A54|nr:class C sortase [Streptococcus agalactiae]
MLLYPVVSRFYYTIESNNQTQDFERAAKKLSQKEINRRMALAQAYNDSLNNVHLEDPYEKKRIQKGIAEYARMLEVSEKIGIISVPKIGQKLPIFAGSSQEVLSKGAGHLEGTSLPIGGNSTHTVITAHSGIPDKELFSNLKKLKKGDKFYIQNIKETIAYQVDQIKVVTPDNFSDLLVVPGHDYATLLTCTPIMVNTHRLLVRGHRIPYKGPIDEKLIKDGHLNTIYRYLFYISLVIIAWLLWLIKRQRQKNRLSSVRKGIES